MNKRRLKKGMRKHKTAKPSRADFFARLKKIYGSKRQKVDGAKLIASDRGSR